MVSTARSDAWWSNPRWALSGDLETETGYDSNLYLRRDSPGGWFVTGGPRLFLKRQGSESRCITSADLRVSGFPGGHDDWALDPSVAIDLASPLRAGRARVEAAASLAQVTEANGDIGERVRRREAQFDSRLIAWSGQKLVLAVRTEAQRVDYRPTALTDYSALGAGAELRFFDRPGLSWDLRHAFSWKAAEPAGSENFKFHTFEQRVLVGGQGNFSAKLSGTAHFGYVKIDLSDIGLADRTEVIGEVNLQWRGRELLAWSLRAEREVHLSSLGEVARSDRYELRMERRVARGVTMFGAGGWRGGDYVTTGLARNDRAWLLSGGVEYRVTDRLGAGVTMDYFDQLSTESRLAFERWRSGVRVTLAL